MLLLNVDLKISFHFYYWSLFYLSLIQRFYSFMLLHNWNCLWRNVEANYRFDVAVFRLFQVKLQGGLFGGIVDVKIAGPWHSTFLETISWSLRMKLFHMSPYFVSLPPDGMYRDIKPLLFFCIFSSRLNCFAIHVVLLLLVLKLPKQ